MMAPLRRVKLTDLNAHLVCVLCSGYFVDATTIIECLHTFCKTCIVRYLQTSSFCPICDVQVHKTKPLLSLREDRTLQDVVFKLVPGLFHSEMNRRHSFYKEHPEAGGDKTEQSLRERRHFFHVDDQISLSLEYLPVTQVVTHHNTLHAHVQGIKPLKVNNGQLEKQKMEDSKEIGVLVGKKDDKDEDKEEKDSSTGKMVHKRYLRCPAAVQVSHLEKFIRLKYNLASTTHKVDIMHGGDCLVGELTLLDVVYMYKWTEDAPLRLMYTVSALPQSRKRPRINGARVPATTDPDVPQSKVPRSQLSSLDQPSQPRPQVARSQEATRDEVHDEGMPIIDSADVEMKELKPAKKESITDNCVSTVSITSSTVSVTSCTVLMRSVESITSCSSSSITIPSIVSISSTIGQVSAATPTPARGRTALTTTTSATTTPRVALAHNPKPQAPTYPISQVCVTLSETITTSIPTVTTTVISTSVTNTTTALAPVTGSRTEIPQSSINGTPQATVTTASSSIVQANTFPQPIIPSKPRLGRPPNAYRINAANMRPVPRLGNFRGPRPPPPITKTVSDNQVTSGNSNLTVTASLNVQSRLSSISGPLKLKVCVKRLEDVHKSHSPTPSLPEKKVATSQPSHDISVSKTDKNDTTVDIPITKHCTASGSQYVHGSAVVSQSSTSTIQQPTLKSPVTHHSSSQPTQASFGKQALKPSVTNKEQLSSSSQTVQKVSTAQASQLPPITQASSQSSQIQAAQQTATSLSMQTAQQLSVSVTQAAQKTAICKASSQAPDTQTRPQPLTTQAAQVPSRTQAAQHPPSTQVTHQPTGTQVSTQSQTQFSQRATGTQAVQQPVISQVAQNPSGIQNAQRPVSSGIQNAQRPVGSQTSQRPPGTQAAQRQTNSQTALWPPVAKAAIRPPSTQSKQQSGTQVVQRVGSHTPQRPGIQVSQELPSTQTSQPPSVTQAAKQTPNTQAAKQTPNTQAAKQTPNTQAAKQTPSTQAAKQTPNTQAAKQTPNTQAAKQTPSTQAAKQTPNTQAAKQTPNTQAAKQMPNTQAAKHMPNTQAAKQTPSTQASQQSLGTQVVQKPHGTQAAQHPSNSLAQQYPGNQANPKPLSIQTSMRPSSAALSQQSVGVKVSHRFTTQSQHLDTPSASVRTTQRPQGNQIPKPASSASAQSNNFEGTNFSNRSLANSANNRSFNPAKQQSSISSHNGEMGKAVSGSSTTKPSDFMTVTHVHTPITSSQTSNSSTPSRSTPSPRSIPVSTPGQVTNSKDPQPVSSSSSIPASTSSSNSIGTTSASKSSITNTPPNASSKILSPKAHNPVGMKATPKSPSRGRASSGGSSTILSIAQSLANRQLQQRTGVSTTATNTVTTVANSVNIPVSQAVSAQQVYTSSNSNAYPSPVGGSLMSPALAAYMASAYGDASVSALTDVAAMNLYTLSQTAARIRELNLAAMVQAAESLPRPSDPVPIDLSPTSKAAPQSPLTNGRVQSSGSTTTTTNSTSLHYSKSSTSKTPRTSSTPNNPTISSPTPEVTITKLPSTPSTSASSSSTATTTVGKNVPGLVKLTSSNTNTVSITKRPASNNRIAVAKSPANASVRQIPNPSFVRHQSEARNNTSIPKTTSASPVSSSSSPSQNNVTATAKSRSSKPTGTGARTMGNSPLKETGPLPETSSILKIEHLTRSLTAPAAASPAYRFFDGR